MDIFDLSGSDDIIFDSPQEMYDSMKNRKIKALYDYQSNILDLYLENQELSDIALEMPTGSGKTLVGLIIGEYLRKNNNEKVLYLCPNNQLVFQTASLAKYEYGIDVTVFTGSAKYYSQEDKHNYESATSIAVTSYSSLFNSNPYFEDPSVIIFDDAHAADDYVSSNWTVNIEKKAYKSLYEKLIHLLRNYIDENTYSECCNNTDMHNSTIDKVPNLNFLKVKDIFKNEIDAFLTENKTCDLRYPWSLIKNNLIACNVFISSNQLVIKPYISPTLTFFPFSNARQRLYMSATLGKSGELERAFGVGDIKFLETDKKWKERTIGRRFFLFPTIKYKDDQLTCFFNTLIASTNRSLVVVNDIKDQESYIDYFNENFPSKEIYTAKSIEQSKDNFIKCKDAVAIVANRYDGINFPNDECRLLIVDDLQKATNIQERFLSSRMGCGVIYTERIRIRLTQLLGRCTRDYADYAIVCILGEDIVNKLLIEKERQRFHPELQAELEFAEKQMKTLDSKNPNDFMKFIDVFLNKRNDWQSAENIIQSESKKKLVKSQTLKFPELDQLKEVAKHEIDIQYSLWTENYKRALVSAEAILHSLKDNNLKGYKGFWHYVNAYIYFLTNNASKSEESLKLAATTTLSVKWFNKLDTSGTKIYDCVYQIEAMEKVIAEKIIKSGNKSELYITLDSIGADLCLGGTKFENAYLEIGHWLGYKVYKRNDTGSPDPIWVIDSNRCIVTESKIYESNPEIILQHIREARTHRDYILKNVEKLNLIDSPEIVTTFISNATKTKDKDTQSFADSIYFVNSESIKVLFGKFAIITKKLIEEFENVGDIRWSETAYRLLRDYELTPNDIYKFFTSTKLKEI